VPSNGKKPTGKGVEGAVDRFIKRLIRDSKKGGVKFEDRMKLAPTLVKWLAVKNKIADPERGSAFEEGED
jgi:hypothetical protein